MTNKRIRIDKPRIRRERPEAEDLPPDPRDQWPCFKVSSGIVTVLWRMMVLKGFLPAAGCRTGSRLVC